MSSTLRFALTLFAATALLTTTAHAEGWTLFGGGEFILEVPADARGIMFSGDDTVGGVLLLVGPNLWFGHPHYAWYDFTDGTSALRAKIATYLSKYGDEDAVVQAADIFEQLELGPEADYELHGVFVEEQDAYHVTATNHVTGAEDTAWVDAEQLLYNPIKAVHPVLQALVNVMSVKP